MNIANEKEIRDAMHNKLGATDTSSEIYTLERFHAIRMVKNRILVEQAHEIRCITRESNPVVSTCLLYLPLHNLTPC